MITFDLRIAGLGSLVNSRARFIEKDYIYAYWSPITWYCNVMLSVSLVEDDSHIDYDYHMIHSKLKRYL